ncbi:hypothetical protein GTO27_10785 [Candidatus Bathyarchaeota archaeon]|nr:hypothetical protein [Candidatus Bathyarchaeota archaeon]
MTKPKNALIKQYKKVFQYDGVDLVFSPDALLAVTRKALSRASGARGLRSVLEGILLNVMYELPSKENVSKCVITKDVVEKQIEPTLVTEGEGLGKEEVSA